jgi:hypothetical protein
VPTLDFYVKTPPVFPMAVGAAVEHLVIHGDRLDCCALGAMSRTPRLLALSEDSSLH